MEENGKIKICFVKFRPEHKKTYMFEMPYSEFLHAGDTVIVPDVENYHREATVVDTDRFQPDVYPTDKEELNRLLSVAGVELPLKRVLGVVERTYYKYEEEVSADEDEDK